MREGSREGRQQAGVAIDGRLDLRDDRRVAGSSPRDVVMRPCDTVVGGGGGKVPGVVTLGSCISFLQYNAVTISTIKTSNGVISTFTVHVDIFSLFQHHDVVAVPQLEMETPDVHAPKVTLS